MEFISISLFIALIMSSIMDQLKVGSNNCLDFLRIVGIKGLELSFFKKKPLIIMKIGIWNEQIKT